MQVRRRPAQITVSTARALYASNARSEKPPRRVSRICPVQVFSADGSHRDDPFFSASLIASRLCKGLFRKDSAHQVIRPRNRGRLFRTHDGTDGNRNLGLTLEKSRFSPPCQEHVFRPFSDRSPISSRLLILTFIFRSGVRPVHNPGGKLRTIALVQSSCPCPCLLLGPMAGKKARPQTGIAVRSLSFSTARRLRAWTDEG